MIDLSKRGHVDNPPAAAAFSATGKSAAAPGRPITESEAGGALIGRFQTVREAVRDFFRADPLEDFDIGIMLDGAAGEGEVDYICPNCGATGGDPVVLGSGEHSEITGYADELIACTLCAGRH